MDGEYLCDFVKGEDGRLHLHAMTHKQFFDSLERSRKNYEEGKYVTAEEMEQKMKEMWVDLMEEGGEKVSS